MTFNHKGDEMKKLIEIKKENALDVFTSEKLDDYLQAIRDDVINVTPDVSTNKGRKQIASNAYKITKKKTEIDAIGKELVTGWKLKAKLVDEARKKSRDFLDNLKNEIRKPLTNWEISEAKRIADEILRQKIISAHKEAIIENDFFDRQKEIERKEAELEAKEIERIEKERIAQEKEKQIEYEKRIAKEAQEKAEKEASEMIEAEKRAKIELEIKVEQEKKRAIKEARIKEALRLQNEKLKIQQAIQKERDIAKQKEAEKLKREKEKIEAEKSKAANRVHQKKINNEALICFVAEGILKEQAKKIIILIKENKIKNITINY